MNVILDYAEILNVNVDYLLGLDVPIVNTSE